MRKMLTPHVRAIGRPAGPAQDDAVDSARVEGTPAALTSDLIRLVGKDQVLHRISDLVRYASDASPYRYLPQVVVLPRTVDDVRAILDYCARSGRHATFRAGGTSLNGQSQSDDILIDVRRHWAGLVVEDGGARLRARPGTILGHANAVLRPVGRRLGPDPASADVATIGGVIANNAGGMRCTLERNAYHTVSSLTLVLASGTVIDTAAPGAKAAFAAAEPELAAGLLQLRSELLADDELAQRVRHKFTIRNTNGYALSALLDADTPLEIFRRLIVGSEGTLAFMAEAVINTIPAPANTTVSWIALPSISEASALVPGLVASGAEAVELMLAPALAAAAQAFPGTPAYWRDLDPHAAALLVEFRADSPAALDAAEARVAGLVAGANLVHPLEFTRDEDLIDLYWRVPTVRTGSFFATASGGIGWGVPAAVGVALADRDRGVSRPVIGLIGDGSSQYSVQVLWTAAQHKLPIVYVVMRNNEYSILKSFAVFEETPGVPGLDLPGLGIAALARGWGCRAVDVETTEELEQEFKTALGADTTTVIVVRTQPQQAML